MFKPTGRLGIAISGDGLPISQVPPGIIDRWHFCITVVVTIDHRPLQVRRHWQEGAEDPRTTDDAGRLIGRQLVKIVL